MRRPISKPTWSDYLPSTKDELLGVVFVFSSLLGFALSFTVLQSNGRPVLFTVCVLVSVLCLALANNKKGIALGFLAFLALRTVWALIVGGSS
jgi:hypothetical protein